MKRLFLSACLVFATLFGAIAQGYPDASMLTPLPLNPKVKSGVLSNGLSYYIMHNEEPKGRANFYIAQKVGSTLETQDQLGLAHFLEHMAFNGTTNYPGKDMLNYLQSKGIRFGADINAYTAFDETVYNIDNVPTADKNLMDSVLLILHDWSGDILLLDAEIEAERGVIQEEWRSTTNVGRRQMTEVLPKIYKEYQYQQMPIGKMDVVMNFKPEVLREYYHKWYRPDLQGIVIVGDFDADEMEKKVIDLFSTIEMPKKAAKRVYTPVSDNDKPIYALYRDPEIANLMTEISFKLEKTPVELRNTVEMYVQDIILEALITTMLNNRLSDFGLEPDCDYTYASVGFGDFYVSGVIDAFNIYVMAKNDSKNSVEDAMAVVSRAFKTGFTSSEYDRAVQEIMANLEKSLAEKDKTNNSTFGKELCSYFVNNEPAPGIETEYQIWSMILPNLPVQGINQFLSQEFMPLISSGKNLVIVTSAPQNDDFEIASEEAMVSTIRQAMNAEYEALAEETIDEPLISELPKPGSTSSITDNPELGTTELVLSNGVKVIIKPTDFAGDEVLMSAFRLGGKRLYTPDQAIDVMFMSDAMETAKWGPFDNKTLPKYLAGKNVSLDFTVNQYTDILNGSSTVRDLPTLFELIYTAFTNLNPDEDTFNLMVERAKPFMASQDKDPQNIFFNKVASDRFMNNPLMENPTSASLEKASFMPSFNLVKQALSNASQYTFIFTGNIDVATLKPLLEQYIATLPVKYDRNKGKYATELATVDGQVEDRFQQPMAIPSTMVFDIYKGSNIPYNVKNSIMISLMGDILDNIFTDTLREEEGGTYGASTSADLSGFTNDWNLIYFFITNAEQQEALITRANEEYLNLLANGADETNFQKAKEAMINQYEINSKKNMYWNDRLRLSVLFPDVRMIQDYEETLRSITLPEFNSFLKSLYNGENRLQVIMEGVPAE